MKAQIVQKGHLILRGKILVKVQNVITLFSFNNTTSDACKNPPLRSR
jgi:hypothetical protein